MAQTEPDPRIQRNKIQNSTQNTVIGDKKKTNPVLNQAYTNSSEHQNVQSIDKETHTDEENSRAPKHIEDGSW